VQSASGHGTDPTAHPPRPAGSSPTPAGVVARGVEHHTPKRGSARLRCGEHSGVPDLCPSQLPGHHPRHGSIRGRRGNGLACGLARAGASPPPIGRATPAPVVGGQAVAPRRTVTGDPRHQAWHLPQQEGGHAHASLAPRTASCCTPAPACRPARRCSSASLWSLGSRRRSRRRQGSRSFPTDPTAATTAKTIAGRAVSAPH